MSVFGWSRGRPVSPAARVPAPEPDRERRVRGAEADRDMAWRVAYTSISGAPVPEHQDGPEADATGAPEEQPLPPGVLGYVVVLMGAGRGVLTDCDIKGRAEAEHVRDALEAAAGKRAPDPWRRHAVVCEVREPGGDAP